MITEKENKNREKERLTLAEAVINKSKLDVPELFIKGELDQMMASFAQRVAQAGMEMQTYLEQAKKTEEDLRKEWRTDAEKRAKLQLIFNEIAKKEAIILDEEKVALEVKHIQEHYPDANKESVGIYVRAQMTNDKVFELLEGKEVTSVKEDEKKKSDK